VTINFEFEFAPTGGTENLMIDLHRSESDVGIRLHIEAASNFYRSLLV
jgi:hypothetical protein